MGKCDPGRLPRILRRWVVKTLSLFRGGASSVEHCCSSSLILVAQSASSVHYMYVLSCCVNFYDFQLNVFNVFNCVIFVFAFMWACVFVCVCVRACFVCFVS